MIDATTVPAKNLTRDELVGELLVLKPVFVREGVTRMALIGSRARGDNRPDSDIDLMIEVDPAVRFSLLDLVGVKHVVEDNLGLPADIVMQRSLRPDIRARTDRDKVEIF
ncbi:MAG: nucleotidyltransferase domain-containing protein [Bauldia sp.]|jgi:predicted nucleotidyltransferase|nr:nucleotidyltransferase domain-containing protein [Bauldia sp.]